jgi:feruloyl esterase
MPRALQDAVLLTILTVGLFNARDANAQRRDTLDVTPDATAEQCDALNSMDFTGVQDAPTQISETKIVPVSGKDPAYCRVQGYVVPQVGFELRMPIANWNGKFLEVGDGGWGGTMFLFLCDGPLRKGYACIASDMGHKALPAQALWALNNLQSQIDFGYRAAHVTALIGNAIVAAYYKRKPFKSMMLGCSTGGLSKHGRSPTLPVGFRRNSCGRTRY